MVMFCFYGWWFAPSIIANPVNAADSTDLYRLGAGDQIRLLCVKNDRVIGTSYTIHPNDVISIQFPSLPNYSNELNVLSDGSVCIPRCAPIKINGMTIEEARDTIRKAFSETGWNPEFFLTIIRTNQESESIYEWFKQQSALQNTVFRIRLDGFVSLPYMGDISAAGQTISQLDNIINNEYNHYPDLSFSILLTEPAESDIYIFGEVKNAGVFMVKHRVSLLHVISLAGGFTHEARPLNTVVIRTVNDTVFVDRINSGLSKKDMKEGAGFRKPKSAVRYLEPGSIVFVPRKNIFKLADYITALRSILIFQGFGIGFQWRFGYEWYY